MATARKHPPAKGSIHSSKTLGLAKKAGAPLAKTKHVHAAKMAGAPLKNVSMPKKVAPAKSFKVGDLWSEEDSAFFGPYFERLK